MFSHRLNHIKQTGLHADMREEDMRKIMVVNSFSFLTAILCTFCGVTLAAISGDVSIFFTAMGFVACFLSILLFNKKRRFAAAKFGLQLTFCLVMLYYGSTFGESTQVLFLGLFLIGLPLLICSRRESALRFFCLVMPLLTLFLLETNYYYEIITPMEMDRSTTFIFRWLIMTVVVLLNFMVITYYQRNINSLLKRFNRRAESLRKRNIVVEEKENELIRANRELENYNERLERVVEQRTHELTTHNHVQEVMLNELNKTLEKLKEKEAEQKIYVKELEMLKKDLLKACEEAERANAAKSTFLRELSHEIRNPLNAILGISQLLASNEGNRYKIPGNIVAYIKNIHTSGRNLFEIINNVLELARIEAGKTDVVTNAPFVLREWVYNVTSVCRDIARVKGVNIHLQIDHKLPEQLISDRAQLTQIANNLLANAIKFTPGHNNVTFSCFRLGADNWCIRVTDEGEGIPEEKQALLFKPFEQADNTIHKRFGGTGLGLAISKRLTELLGGSISLWSEPGIGSAFTVTLPLISCMEEPEKSGEMMPAKNEQKPQLQPGRKVLLMEDSATNQLVMKEFFAHLDIPLLVTDNGDDGLRIARERLPDMIILDMHMPGMSGVEVIRAIRRDAMLHHTPIIVISADAFEEQRKIAYSEGVNEYLTKPVLFEELSSMVDQYLHSTMPLSEPEAVIC